MGINLVSFLTSLFGDQLACQVEFLRCENRILKRRIHLKYIIPKPQERYELLKYGKTLGRNLKDIISIVNYETFQRWLRQENDPAYRTVPFKKRGPKPKAPEIRRLIVEMAKKNAWGITRILGELHKLRIFAFSRSTVATILKSNGIPPLAERHEPWINGLKRHYDTLIACDFFKQWVWTLQGPRMAFVLFYINIRTRKIKIAGITKHPKNNWVLEQTRKVFDDPQFTKGGRQILIRDLDGKFSREYDGYFKSMNYDIFKTPPRSPNLNAFAESCIAKIKNECTNHFVIFGMRHLKYLAEEYADYYNTKRPHMNNGFMPPEGPPEKTDGKIRASPILGGLHHHYHRE